MAVRGQFPLPAHRRPARGGPHRSSPRFDTISLCVPSRVWLSLGAVPFRVEWVARTPHDCCHRRRDHHHIGGNDVGRRTDDRPVWQFASECDQCQLLHRGRRAERGAARIGVDGKVCIYTLSENTRRGRRQRLHVAHRARSLVVAGVRAHVLQVERSAISDDYSQTPLMSTITCTSSNV
jgi:hypothetical protein